MSKLDDAQRALADHLATRVQADPVAAVIPVQPAAWAGYVHPADNWVTRDEADEAFCIELRVNLVFDLLAAVVDLEHSQTWISDRVNETLSATRSGVEVLPGELVFPLGAELLGVVATFDGGELLAVRIPFSPFTLED